MSDVIVLLRAVLARDCVPAAHMLSICQPGVTITAVLVLTRDEYSTVHSSQVSQPTTYGLRWHRAVLPSV